MTCVQAVSASIHGAGTLIRGMEGAGWGTLIRGMREKVGEIERPRVRVTLDGSGQSNVATGLPVLDHLLVLLAAYGALDMTLQVAPGAADEEVASAGKALGEELRGALHAPDVRGHGSAAIPADEALAHVALDASGRPLVVMNVDLSEAHVGGLRTDLVSSFLRELAEGAGITLHVRLIGGDDPQHVLEAIFKALGVAVAQACRPTRGKE
jgi:imidazoleglycerol-phosphate dehydratase